MDALPGADVGERQDRSRIAELFSGGSELGSRQPAAVRADIDGSVVWAQREIPVAVRGFEKLSDIALDGAAVLGESQAVERTVLQARDQQGIAPTVECALISRQIIHTGRRDRWPADV